MISKKDWRNTEGAWPPLACVEWDHYRLIELDSQAKLIVNLTGNPGDLLVFGSGIESASGGMKGLREAVICSPMAHEDRMSGTLAA